MWCLRGPEHFVREVETATAKNDHCLIDEFERAAPVTTAMMMTDTATKTWFTRT